MIKTLFLVLSVVLLIGAVAQAADTAAAATSTTPRIEGTIQKIDAAKSSITVMVGTESKTFTFNSTTKFTTEGKAATPDDMKIGQKVFIDADAKSWAKGIDLTPPETK